MYIMVTWVELLSCYTERTVIFKITNYSLKCFMVSEITAFDISLSVTQIIYLLLSRPTNAKHTHKHTHTHIHIYIYIYIH